MRALNHPQKGSSTRVEPIRSEKDIRNIKKLLSDHPRNLCLFTFAINVNLRASDLLRIKVGDVRGLGVGEYFTITEKKTGKKRCITLNRSVHQSIKQLLGTMPGAQDHEPLFQSRKGRQAMCVPYLNSLVKGWARALNLRGNYGSHSLRKTFGYIHRTVHNTSVPVLMTMFNHSTQRQTLQYLGIQEADIQNAYLKEI